MSLFAVAAEGRRRGGVRPSKAACPDALLAARVSECRGSWGVLPGNSSGGKQDRRRGGSQGYNRPCSGLGPEADLAETLTAGFVFTEEATKGPAQSQPGPAAWAGRTPEPLLFHGATPLSRSHIHTLSRAPPRNGWQWAGLRRACVRETREILGFRLLAA